MAKKKYRIFFIGGIVLLVILCLVAGFAAVGSGLGLWFFFNPAAESPAPTIRPTRRSAAAPTFTPTTSPTTIPTATPTATATPSPSPTATAPSTPTPLPPTATLVPPTDIPTSTSAPPTSAPLPTDTPTPSYPFAIAETAQFPTNHLNFDVFVAVTDNGNRPLSGYRLLGAHSSGVQINSQVSANDWTVNSGAMHYKGGNMKYEAPNSATGMWTLQLVDEANNPVAPPVQFSFDAAKPSWYFLLYRLN